MKNKTAYFYVFIGLIIIVFFYSNIRKKVYFKLFHKSGVIAHYNKNGRLEGEYYEYDNGCLISEGNFRNGLYDGWITHYYTSGRIKSRSFYKSNKIDSIAFEFYPNGKIQNKKSYVNGKCDGIGISYYQDGRVEHTWYAKNNKSEGQDKSYYKNGNLECERRWVNNLQYGDLYYYYENKKLKVYHTYDIKGEKFYISRYDQAGRVLKDTGYIFSDNIYSKNVNNDSIVVLTNSHKFSLIKDLYITVAKPPDIHTEIRIVVNGKLLSDLIFVDNNTVKISNVFQNKGTYHISIDGVFVDKSNLVNNSLGYKLTVMKE